MIKLSLKRKNTPYTSEWGHLWFNNRKELFSLMRKQSNGVDNFYMHTFTRDFDKDEFADLEDYLYSTIIGGFCWDNEKDKLDKNKFSKWLAEFENYDEFKKDLEKADDELEWLLDYKGYIIEVNEHFYLVPEKLEAIKNKTLFGIISAFYGDDYEIIFTPNAKSTHEAEIFLINDLPYLLAR